MPLQFFNDVPDETHEVRLTVIFQNPNTKCRGTSSKFQASSSREAPRTNCTVAQFLEFEVSLELGVWRLQLSFVVVICQAGNLCQIPGVSTQPRLNFIFYGEQNARSAGEDSGRPD
jgi:hypothetical protein